MAIQPSPCDCAFMYLPVFDIKDNSNKVYLAHNICNPVGYLPFVGAIAGIARIIFSLIAYTRFDFDFFKSYCKYNILRGCIELMPLSGIPLLITDIIQSVRFRHIFSPQK